MRLSAGFSRRPDSSVGLEPLAHYVPVGQFFDLTDNASEWCSDRRGDGFEIARGGGETSRGFHAEGTRRADIGFRIVLDLGQQSRPRLGELLADGDWERGREIALANAFDSDSRHARSAARAYFEAREQQRFGGGVQMVESVFTSDRGGRKYQLVRLPLPWSSAARMAHAAGGRLAGRDDVANLEWLGSLDEEEPTAIWLGARRDATGWTWENGDSTNAIGLPETESTNDCLELTADHQLAATDGSEPKAFVIEWDPRAGSNEVAQGQDPF